MTGFHPKACVIGWPIAHSRSPLIHGYWLKQNGIAGEYGREPVEPQNLASFFDSLRHGKFVGCNVTLPHKQSALQFVDLPDDRVKRIGALNTVWVERGKLHATSTDGPGFINNIRSEKPSFRIDGADVVILGAGGSARAIVDELLREGAAKIAVSNRTMLRAQELVQLFGTRVSAVEAADLPHVLAGASLLVNTTSAGIGDGGKIELPWLHLNPKAVVSDISYVPLVTPFLREAQSRGHEVVTGLGMLLHQAVLGFEKWFGVKPTVTKDLFKLVARDIDPEFKP